MLARGEIGERQRQDLGRAFVPLGGADASTPMATGLAMNVITKSGGNQFKGSAAYAYQPLEWNDNNASN
ncbi:MAG: hypothetical protein L0221_10590, partial [Chloroflexi bacterium]|nr:hypothetical protein [Chloroflexota bacterium]